MAIITILIVLVILVILYLCYVLYDNYQKKDKQEEFISKITKKSIDKEPKLKSIIKKPKKELGDLSMKIMIDNKEKIIKIKLYDEVVPLTCKNFRVLKVNGVRNKTYKNAK